MLDEQRPTDSNIIQYTRGPRIVKTLSAGYNYNFCRTQTGKIHRKSSKYRFENLK